MSGKQNSNPPGSPHWLLRRSDQATVAVLVLIGFGSMVGWWIAHGGARGRLIEIDRADPLRASFQVDINRAEWPELAQLPGIGETLARRIVESRRRDGPFFDHQDLNRVQGIGPKTLEEIRPYLLPLPPQAAAVGQPTRSQRGAL
jgi:competence protein ComEA